ncbi:MAG: DDE-type integrase/transposase/recombinase [Dehalococcoidia bacterium]
MNSVTPLCKYCGSMNVVKFGTFEGVQRYYCKDCNRKFADNDALPKMKTPVRVIASAMSCYFGGMPLDSIQRHLNQQFDLYFSESGIYNWVIRFSREAVERAKAFKPTVGDTWVADETMLKVGGRNVWYFDIIDSDSRFLIASHLTLSRTTNDAALVMRKALHRAGKSPRRIITDKLAAYIDGIELVFGADTKHIQSKPFVEIDSTNKIERFHGTLKDRTNVVRGFKNMDTAKLLTDGWLVHYNFLKEHEALGNVPPAQKMGETPFKDWIDIIEGARHSIIIKAPVAKPSIPKPKSRIRASRRRIQPSVSLITVRQSKARDR